jgi:restriction endonuclease S subunit
MNSEWQELNIDELKADTTGSIAIGPFGSRMKSDCYVQSGVSVIRGTNLTSGRDFSGDFVFITPEKAQELGSANLQPDDLVFPHRGSIGEVGIVPNDGKQYVLSSSLMKLKCDMAKANPLFIYYFFKSSKGRAELLKNTSQVGTPGIGQPLTSLKSIRLRLPDVTEQQRIASFLCAIDDRIALLRETNATLEGIAQTLFKSWFVDFDPVHAKQQGLVPEGMDEAAAALFPDSFEETELGWVPKGWRACSFIDTITVIGGGTPKTSVSEYWNGDISWFSVVDAPAATDVFVIDTEKHITEVGLNNSSAKLLPAGTTIISARGTVGRLALVGQEMAMNQSCYGLRGKAGDDYFTYFSTFRIVETLKQRTHGSVFDTITRDTMSGVSIIYPTEMVISAFESLLSPVMERIKENLKQAQALAIIRDILLPRLISGQLRLPETTERVTEILTGT